MHLDLFLIKVRAFLDLSKDRRIEKLKKDENQLYEYITRSSQVSLDGLKEKLASLTSSYHKIQATAYLRRHIGFLEGKTILLEKCLQNPALIPHDIKNIIISSAWGLVKLNSDQAPEFAQLFKPFIGDVTRIENLVDRQLYFYLAWLIPENIECIKYLKGFLDRRSIPYDKINHLGWIDDNIERHIRSLERQEINRSKLRSQLPPPNPPNGPGPTSPAPNNGPTEPFKGTPPGPTSGKTGGQGSQAPGGFGAGTQGTSPILKNFTDPFIDPQPNPFSTKFPLKTDQSFGAPDMINLNLPSAPNDQCTQGEIGLEVKKNYADDFEKDLEDLKVIKQPELSPEEAEDIQRRVARNQDFFDQTLLKALTENSPTVPNPTKQSIINPSEIGGLKNVFGENPDRLGPLPQTGLPPGLSPLGGTQGFKTDLIESNFIPSKNPADNFGGGLISDYQQRVPNYYENSEGQNYGYGKNPHSYIHPEKSYLAPNPKLNIDEFLKLLRRVGA